MSSLIVVSGPNQDSYYPLGKRTMVVGRDQACPIQLTDGKVSRQHVQIRFDAAKNQHVVLDMKSANGTLVNGRAVNAETPLVDGDEITVGESRLVFFDREFPDKASAFNSWKVMGQRSRATLEER
ncbi:MAG TPA: FHA domain-containing protein [Phycisphaerales bacterium]|nr:FHA domain-containing protein [Phycisphaerales bacterium]